MNKYLKGALYLGGLVLLFFMLISVAFPVPCKQPIRYAIGTVDPRFAITRTEFQYSILQAEKLWEDSARIQLFMYDPSAHFTINLLYDERQKTTDEAKKLSDTLAHTAVNRRDVKNKYDTVYAKYSTSVKAYSDALAQYEEDMKTYNERVQQFNESKGGDVDIYNELQLQKTRLQERAEELDTQRMKLNVLATQVNGFAKTEGQIVNTYNQAVTKFNNLYGNTREFDQGEYVGSAINVYEFITKKDLQLVLEHELGHALGIGHVENKKSVMYYEVTPENETVTSLSPEDKKALEEQCKKSSVRVFIDRLLQSSWYAELVKKFNS